MSIKKILCMTMAALMCLSIGASASAAEKSPATVTVSASASVSVSPDYATVSFGIETREKTATKAQADNAIGMKKIIDAVKKQGVDEKNIETSNMYMYPTYDYSSSDPKITGYSVSNTITVTVLDLNKISSIVNAAMDAGANTFQGVTFLLKDDESTYQKALKLATEKGAKRAKVLAEAAGMQLDGIASISDNGSNQYYPMAASRATAGDVVAESAAKIGDTIQPGKIQVSAQVTITYFLK